MDSRRAVIITPEEEEMTEMASASEAIDRLRASYPGEVISPDDAAYEEARKVWNGTVDRRPAVIVRPKDTNGVAEAVNFARENGLNATVRGGGHNVAGSALNDGGVVIDLSLMRAVDVDAGARTVRAQGGVTLGDIDAATQAHGLAVPVGVVSETGIAGLTLGGGVGYMRRKYGLSCDNLISAEVVTADGSVLTASENENPDLFWALRGGGQGACAVTSFEFKAYPLGPDVFLCLVFHPWEQARDLFRFFREYTAEAPEEIGLLAFAATLPHEEFVPQASRGRKSVAYLAVYVGDPADGERLLQPVRDVATPLFDASEVTSYVDAQKALDEDYPNGRRYYWKSTYLKGLEDETIDAIVELGETYPSPLTTVDLWHNGGAMARPASDTAFAGRDAPYTLTFEANWDDPADDGTNIAWAREGWQKMQRFSTGGLYVNFPGGVGDAETGEVAYGENWDRLQAVRRRHDANSLFV
jgi:FAD/FMN-containing dehydrogenase